jgi:Flp pilus assembly protein TadB
MDILQIVIIGASVIVLAGGGALAYVLVSGGGAKQSEFRGLMAGSAPQPNSRLARAEVDPYSLDADEMLRRNKKGKKGEESIDRKLFRAGYYTAKDKASFNRFRISCALMVALTLPVGFHLLLHDPMFTVISMVLGVFIGYAYPVSIVEKGIRRREEDILYYLPLVIEQISIGVSSALDIGPCIAQIVEMADERGSHNVVTEMMVHVEKLIKSGLNLDDALHEVADANGMTEVKHAFMFLAQCAKHGGEISKQLQELADSISVARQVHIEGKITALPVKATGPLTMVFAGFFALLFSGLMVRLMTAFGNTG